MKHIFKHCIATVFLFLSFLQVKAQVEFGGGTVTGNVESVFQYYRPDSIINAQVPPERTGMNSFANINYRNGNFRTGVRFESYMPALLGYPQRFNGTGLGYRYAGYSTEELDITVGNFYDQFGSGMIFRAFEERALGLDNAMDGVHIKYRPIQGIEFKGIWGKQRFEFNDGLVNGPGTVRAFDAEFNLNQAIEKLKESKWNLTVAGSFVSKFQRDQNPQLIMPENVASYGGRAKLTYGNYFVSGEYVFKDNDPSADNGYIYKSGQGILLNAGYSKKGLGILVQAKSIDNMSFRSNRDALLTDVQINYLPALTKTHTYNLAATLYPFATIPQGEIAYQADIIYNIPKGSILGGEYGTNVAVNFSTAYDIKRQTIAQDSLLRGYTSSPFATNFDSLFFRDFNIEIKRKLNSKTKMTVVYYNQVFNADANIVSESSGYIFSNIVVVDLTYNINRKHSIRGELQGLWTKQDQGDWATLLLEYTISPNWNFGVIDQWNYGNEVDAKRVHYLLGSVSYIKDSMRFMVNFGKQRAGIFCVGGICRQVPASNGVSLTFTYSF
jgi:hypothetical protein